LIITPGEDAALVAIEHRAVNPALMLEGGAELLTGADVPQPCCTIMTPGEDAALVAIEHRTINRIVVFKQFPQAHNVPKIQQYRDLERRLQTNRLCCQVQGFHIIPFCLCRSAALPIILCQALFGSVTLLSRVPSEADGTCQEE